MVKVVAEAGQCMEGSTVEAKLMAEKAADAGAWGFKVQMLDPDLIATPFSKKYWNDDLGTHSQHEAFVKAGVIAHNDWADVVTHCQVLGLEFLATPFDEGAVEALKGYETGWVKIASGDITNTSLLRAVGALPDDWQIVLSSGAATTHEIDAALGHLGRKRLYLLACTLAYPTPIEQAHLARIETLRERYPWLMIGYSDHTSHHGTALAAAAMGAEMLEVHYTRRRFGKVADQAMAVTPQELAVYVEAAEFGAKLRGSYEIAAQDIELPAKEGARRSLYTATEVAAGDAWTAANVIALRPAADDLVPADQTDLLLGRAASRKYRTGEPIPLVEIQ